MSGGAAAMGVNVQEADTAGRVAGSAGQVDLRGVEVSTPRDASVENVVSGVPFETGPRPIASTVGASPEAPARAIPAIEGKPLDELNAGQQDRLRRVTGEDGYVPPRSDLRRLTEGQ
jgi:hypothetical protein